MILAKMPDVPTVFPVEYKIFKKKLSLCYPREAHGFSRQISANQVQPFGQLQLTFKAMGKEQREENKKAFEGEAIRQTFRKLGLKKWKQLITENWV